MKQWSRFIIFLISIFVQFVLTSCSGSMSESLPKLKLTPRSFLVWVEGKILYSPMVTVTLWLIVVSLVSILILYYQIFVKKNYKLANPKMIYWFCIIGLYFQILIIFRTGAYIFNEDRLIPITYLWVLSLFPIPLIVAGLTSIILESTLVFIASVLLFSIAQTVIIGIHEGFEDWTNKVIISINSR